MTDYQKKSTPTQTKKKRRYHWDEDEEIATMSKFGWDTIVVKEGTKYRITITEDADGDYATPVYEGYEKTLKAAQRKAEKKTNSLIQKHGGSSHNWTHDWS